MHKLTILDLSFTAMGDGGCHALVPALDNAVNLEDLRLANNRISDKGVSILTHAFTTISKLKKLDLGQNRISEEGCNKIVAAMKKAKMSEMVLLNLVDNIHLLRVVQVEMFMNAKTEELKQELMKAGADTGDACRVPLTWFNLWQYHLDVVKMSAADWLGTGLTPKATDTEKEMERKNNESKRLCEELIEEQNLTSIDPPSAPTPYPEESR